MNNEYTELEETWMNQGLPAEFMETEPLEEENYKEQLLEDLAEASPNKSVEVIRNALKYPETVPDVFTDKQMILLKLLMNSHIGTGSQRGSITRILNTLESLAPERNVDLATQLQRRARQVRLRDQETQ